MLELVLVLVLVLARALEQELELVWALTILFNTTVAPNSLLQTKLNPDCL